MLSRVPMTVAMVQVPSLMRSCALPIQTSGAVGQTRDLQKVGECLRLGIDEHLAHERRAALRQRERARQRADVLRRDAECFRGRKQRHDRRVAHGDLHDGDTGVIFEIAIDGRHIVAELVQLTNGIVNGMEVEVRGDVIGILVVCGVLHRAEIVDLFALWHDEPCRPGAGPWCV